MVTIIGSLNMDLVVTADRAQEGETVQGSFPGFRAAKEPIRQSQLGAAQKPSWQEESETTASVKPGPFSGSGFIDTSAIERIAGVQPEQRSRSTAEVITASWSSGDNGAWTASHVEAIRSLIAQSNVLLLQLEIPLEAVARAVTIAREENVFCMVNPAPALPLPADFYPSIDLLTPNENELGLLSGITLGGPRGWRNAARVLLNRGLPAIVVTLGEEGSLPWTTK